MSVADVVLCWLVALPAVIAFYLIYTVIEEIIRNPRKPAKVLESKLCIERPSLSEPPDKHNWPLFSSRLCTPALFREDALMHVRQLEYKEQGLRDIKQAK